jgi:hypothetical protein
MGVTSLSRDGIVANQKYTTALAGNDTGDVALSSDFLIQEVVLNGTATSVTFDVSTLAALGYKHLQIRMAANSSASGATYWRFNADSGNNYAQHRLYGNGSSVASNATTSTNAGYIGYTTAGTNIFPGSILDILDFASSTKNKTVRILHGDNTANIMLNSGVWLSTSAVTSVTLYANVNYVTGSRMSLYGSKG